MSDTVEKCELSGRAFDIDGYDTLYVFPGIAYRRRSLSAERSYCEPIGSIRAAGLMDNHDCHRVTRTVVEDTSGRAYIPVTRDQAYRGGPSRYAYLHDERVWHFDGRLLLHDEYSSEHSELMGAATSACVRLVCDDRDLVFRIEDLKERVSAEQLQLLWGVSRAEWEQATD